MIYTLAFAVFVLSDIRSKCTEKCMNQHEQSTWNYVIWLKYQYYIQLLHSVIWICLYMIHMNRKLVMTSFQPFSYLMPSLLRLWVSMGSWLYVFEWEVDYIYDKIYSIMRRHVSIIGWWYWFSLKFCGHYPGRWHYCRHCVILCMHAITVVPGFIAPWVLPIIQLKRFSTGLI